MFRNAAFVLPLRAEEEAADYISKHVTKPVAKPSFDCANIKARAKVLICADEALAALDVQEDALLRRARAKAVTPDAVNAEQDLWLSERDACTSAGCLTVTYRRRIRELHNWTN